MHRAGVDPEQMAAEDFLCDFCLRCWAEERPMVEGHRGSLICGGCLTAAYARVIVEAGGVLAGDPRSCTMCLMHKPGEMHWQSDAVEGLPLICRWCIDKSAGMLERDNESAWVRPKA